MFQIIHADSAEQFEAAKALFEEYAGSLGFDLDFQDFDAELANLPGDYAPPKGCLLLAMQAGEPAGCAALREIAAGVCEMKRLYVKPSARGAGIAKALAGEIIAAARRIGYTAMRLDTVASMTAANTLYKSLGFKEIGPYRTNPLPDAVFMELKL